MPKRDGKRVQIKRTKFPIKQAIVLNQDPLPFISKLIELESRIDHPQNQENPSYKLTPIEYKINYPDFNNINKDDPRYELYRFRHLTRHL